MFWAAMDLLREWPRHGSGHKERRVAIVIARSSGVRYVLLAEAFGISRERVRQTEARAWTHMRSARFKHALAAAMRPS